MMNNNMTTHLEVNFVMLRKHGVELQWDHMHPYVGVGTQSIVWMVFPGPPTFAVHHVVHLCGCGVGLSGDGGTGGLELAGGGS